jgi:hypothetical protein
MVSTMLFWVGLLVFLAGAVASWRQRSRTLVARAILRRMAVPISDVRVDDVVRIEGTIVEAREPFLVAPCSGESVVWFRVRAQVSASSGGGDGTGGLSLTLADEQAGSSFYVADASGDRIRIVADAHVEADPLVFRTLSIEAHDRLRLFLESRGHQPGADVYEEQRLRIGDTVTVLGRAQRELRVSRSDTYRDSVVPSMALTAPTGGRLLVTTPAARKRYRAGIALAGVAVVAGLLAIVAGLVVHAFE